MWGPATVIALSEQYRIAEEHSLKVRAELFRLRCSGEIFVEQDKTCLKLTYGEESVVKQPLRLLTILKEVQQVDSSDDFWVLLKKEETEPHASLWLMMCALGFLVLFVLATVAIATYF
jgi:hypothetical protein